MTNDRDKNRELKHARKAFIREHGREPTEVELQASLAPIPLQVDVRSRSTALTVVEPTNQPPQDDDWWSAPWDKNNPLYLMALGHAVATSEKPGRRPAMLQMHLSALQKLLKPYVEKNASAAAEWCSDILQTSAELSAIGAGERSPWFEPVRDAGSEPGNPKITRALRSAIIFTVMAGECAYRLQPSSQRSFPKAFETVLTEIRDRIAPLSLDDAYPDGAGGAQTNKNGLKEEVIATARAEILAKLVRRFDKRYRHDLRSNGDDYASGLYQTNLEIIRQLSHTGLREHYATYIRIAATGLQTASAATEHRIKPRKERMRRISKRA